ncbi:hypothetical protein Joe_52 [Streptomyces phage Joe]|uniref:Uncharacterized protein n=1 Tax=Streptomyces phage Joe TaxID=1913034 RepID=A0A1J0GP28_9CAUD|nr:hypothetical protein KGG94_gp52 [Streptomyces phage Joe]APC43292.1 hypothetical protein Joe_52 [Streptomyces phage Joe]
MNGQILERLAETVLALPEDQREAFVASIVPSRPAPAPRLAGEPRPLPPPRTRASVTTSVRWV